MLSIRAGLVLLTLAACTLATPEPGKGAAQSVQSLITARLPKMGHRNWIVVADSAYPLQTSPGIETITVSAEQAQVVREVLRALSKTRHVRPTIYLDRELEFVSERNAPGIGKYRSELKKALGAAPVSHLLHEDIIAKLDDAGKTFNVLLIKTPLTLPYTSVFFQLECGYWSAGAEKQLRESMAKAPK